MLRYVTKNNGKGGEHQISIIPLSYIYSLDHFKATPALTVAEGAGAKAEAEATRAKTQEVEKYMVEYG